MIDYHLDISSPETLAAAKEFLETVLESKGRFSIHLHETKKEGSQQMLNTWMMWMAPMAEYMASQGVKIEMRGKEGKVINSRPPNKEEAHAFFTKQFLGVDDKGNRKSWSSRVGKGQVKADMGDKLWCMDRLVEFATSRGVELKIPSDSEYMKLKREHDKGETK